MLEEVRKVEGDRRSTEGVRRPREEEVREVEGVRRS